MLGTDQISGAPHTRRKIQQIARLRSACDDPTRHTDTAAWRRGPSGMASKYDDDEGKGEGKGGEGKSAAVSESRPSHELRETAQRNTFQLLVDLYAMPDDCAHSTHPPTHSLTHSSLPNARHPLPHG